MLNIVTDSTADLNPEFIEKYGIKVVPLQVTVEDTAYKDGVEIDQGKLFELVEEAGTLPKTAAPSVAEFIAAFQEEGENLYIGLSSRLSATVQNANLAAAEVGGKVRVIDSLNLSGGIALLVLKAAELREQGCVPGEIERRIREMVPRVRTTFVIETLRYLHMGGRCSALQAMVGTVLKIRPQIEMREDGTLGVRARVRGKRKRALDKLIADFKADLPNVDRSRVMVGHAACPEDAEYVAGEIEKLADPGEIIIYRAGSVISSHCGPGTVGLMYALK